MSMIVRAISRPRLAVPMRMNKSGEQVLPQSEFTRATPMVAASTFPNTVCDGTGLVVAAGGTYTCEILATFGNNFLGTRKGQCVRRSDGAILLEVSGQNSAGSGSGLIVVNNGDVLDFYARSDVLSTNYRTLMPASFMSITPA